MESKKYRATRRSGDTYIVDAARYDKTMLAIHRLHTLLKNLYELCYVSEKCLNYCPASNRHLKTTYTAIYCSTIRLLSKAQLMSGYMSYRKEQDEEAAKSSVLRDFSYYDKRFSQLVDTQPTDL